MISVKIAFFSLTDFLKKVRDVDKFCDTVLISIIDPDLEPLDIFTVSKFEDFISCRFWDSSREQDINRDELRKLLDFIHRNRDRKFFIHCQMGISRSPAVAMAVECILKFNGNRERFFKESELYQKIKNNRVLIPNWLVFDMLVSLHLERLSQIKPVQEEGSKRKNFS